MAEIVKELGWRYVHTIYEEGNYGEKGIQEFERVARSKGICIARQVKINAKKGEASAFVAHECSTRNVHPISETKLNKVNPILIGDFEANVETLLNNRSSERVRVAVIFATEEGVKALLATLQKYRARHRDQQHELYFLGSDAWGIKSHVVEGNNSKAALGALTLLPKRNAIHEFTHYFLNLTAAHNETNPWWNEYWDKYLRAKCSRADCELDGNVSSAYQAVGLQYKQEGYVQKVFDAVFALAYALRDLIAARCPQLAKLTAAQMRALRNSSASNELATLCPVLFPEPNGTEVLQFIRRVRFKGTPEIAAFF